MPVDHRIQHLHDDERADRLMFQPGLSRVAQAKPADDDREIDALSSAAEAEAEDGRPLTR